MTDAPDMKSAIRSIGNLLGSSFDETASLRAENARLRTELEAAKGDAIGVKALAWEEPTTGPDQYAHITSTPFGGYHISRPASTWNLLLPDGSFMSFEDLQTAKAAAQADFDRRIRSALTADKSEAEAKEEQIREDIAREWIASYDDVQMPDYEFADRMMKFRDKHEGDCPHVTNPAPMACSGCLVDHALEFAERARSRAQGGMGKTEGA